jgi:hypothetical protein
MSDHTLTSSSPEDSSSPELSRDRRHFFIEEAAALAEIERRKEANPLYYFQPHEKLDGYHSSRSILRMVSGANRSGKTEHLVAETAAAALGYRPWVLRQLGLPPPDKPWERPNNLPEKALFLTGAGIRINVPSEVFLVTGLPAKRGIAETLHPKVKKLLGPCIEKTYYTHQNIPVQVKLKNGTVIDYGSATQRGLAFEATNKSHYGVDEPIPKRVYTGIRRGAIDQHARIDFSFTPLGPCAGWMFRDLYSRAGKESFVDAFTVTIYDNPYLSPEAIAAFEADPTISDVEKQARLYGRFLHLVDRIYPQFDEEVHIIPDFMPDPTWIHGVVLDPHTVRPWAIAWFCITPAGDLIWFREWPAVEFRTLRRDERTVDDYANLLYQIEGQRPVDFRFADPNYFGRQDVVRGQKLPSVADIFSARGLHFNTQIPDDLIYGEARVRALLAFDRKQPVSATNRPRMYFTEGCRNLIDSMLYYTAASGDDDEFTQHETRRDESFKDFADVVRYAAASGVMDNALTDTWLDQTFGASYNETTGPSGPYGEPDYY